MLLSAILVLPVVFPPFVAQATPLSTGNAAAVPLELTLVNQIGGETYSVKLQGNYAYMGVGPRLVVLDITSPGQPVVIGQTEVISNSITDIEISGSYAYVTEGTYHSSGGLRIIDISNPVQPHTVGFYATPFRSLNLAMVGNYAYVAAESYGLRVVDVSNPANPVEVTAIVPDSYAGGSTRDVVIVGHYAYVAEHYNHGLHILDISDPANPITLGRYADRAVHGVAVAGNYAYLACTGTPTGGLSIVNISNPAMPQEVGFYQAEVYSAWVRIRENYVYLSTKATYPFPTRYLRIVNVANPTAPVLTGVFSLPYNSNDLLAEACQFDLAANLVYLAAGMHGLQIVNIANPAAPAVVGAYNIPTRPGAIAVEGNHLYVADERWTQFWNNQDVDDLHVMDITNPAQPHSVGVYDTPGMISSIVVSGTYAFVGKYARYNPNTNAAVEGGMLILNISDPAHPVETGFYDSEKTTVDAIAVQGNYAYLNAGTGSGKTHVVNISTPSTPQYVGEYVGESNYLGNDITVSGDYAYWGRYGLDILSIANPATPTRVGKYDNDYEIYSVAISGDYAYFGDHRLQIIDVTDPANPTLTGSLSIGSGLVINDIVIVDRYAYLAVGGSGLHVVDVSDPESPVEVFHYSTLGVANSVVVSGNTVYLTSEAGGIYIFAPPATISGTVADARGEPIVGAMIAANDFYTATTDASGVYTLTNISAGNYTLIPSKDGVLWWEPAQRTITVPPDATEQNFTGYHVRKSVTPEENQVVAFGDVLTYTIQIAPSGDGSFRFYDPIPIYTTYVAGSLDAPDGINYDAHGNIITGTLSTLTTNEIVFAVSVGITGSVTFAPPITNRACIFPDGESLEQCEWSNTTMNNTYAWKVYLPLVLRNKS
jgi:hypothetical protein